MRRADRSEVPPLMFTREELEALVVGARFTRAFAGHRLAAAAEQALVKVEAVLPEDLRRRSEGSRIVAPATRARDAERLRLDHLHRAIDSALVVTFRYTKDDGAASERAVEPLCLAFWGRAWMLGAWCRARGDFRTFRVDRIDGLQVTDEHSSEDPARGLRAYLAAMGASPQFQV